jgi:uncharacterized protein
MNLNELELNKNGHRILYRVVTGSHAYGLENENSDIDEKGIFWVPYNEFISLDPPVTPQASQISDDNNDKTFYNIYRIFELLKKSNPNILEMLWVPEDCVKFKHPLIDIIIKNRNMFISKELYETHVNYAYQQIKKARGRNKRVHNPQPKEAPLIEDFCYIINFDNFVNNYRYRFDGMSPDSLGYPARPVPLSKSKIDLSEYHAASMEQMPHTYRIYHYGDKAKGVFRGDVNKMLVCESIPKEDEWPKFKGFLVYNIDGHAKATKEWKQYWEWYEKRNNSRWVDQESGELDYDSKNMSHCIRLMLEAKNILEKGEPIIRFEGEAKEYLLKIKNGEFDYDKIILDVEKLNVELSSLFKTSSIPDKVDESKINKLYQEIMSEGESIFGDGVVGRNLLSRDQVNFKDPNIAQNEY